VKPETLEVPDNVRREIERLQKQVQWEAQRGDVEQRNAERGEAELRAWGEWWEDAAKERDDLRARAERAEGMHKAATDQARRLVLARDEEREARERAEAERDEALGALKEAESLLHKGKVLEAAGVCATRRQRIVEGK